MTTKTEMVFGNGLDEMSKELGFGKGLNKYVPIRQFDEKTKQNKYYVNKKYQDGRKSFVNGQLRQSPYVQLFDQSGKFYTNSKLTVEEYRLIDKMVMGAQKNYLSVVNQLVGSNLVSPIPHIGVKEITYQQTSHGQTGTGEGVTASMQTNVLKSRSAIDKKQVSIPVPFFAVRVEIDLRDLVATENGTGESLELTEIREASEEINQALNLMALNGLPNLQYKQGVVRGLNDSTLYIAQAAPGDWGTYGNIHPTFVNAIGTLENTSKIPGPFNVLINATQYNQLRNTNTQTDKSAIQVVMETFNLPGQPPKINSIEPVQYGLNDGELLFYAADTKWIEWRETMATQVIELPKSDLDGVVLAVVAMATMVVKKDYYDTRAIVKVTGA